MFLYNFLSKSKEEFKPIHSGKVGMYVCGPTVYDHCHLGHGRGYVAMDVLRRYLEHQGYEVRYILNYTDVGHQIHNAEQGEDKIEQRAKQTKTDPIAIADTYIISAEEDFKALNIKPATFNPRPTQYVAQIIKFIEELLAKDYAYISNGSVYFSVKKFTEYGKLSGRKIEELMEGARVEINPEKRNPLDFALWIKAAPDHILKWPSPWSEGYPGWHIECSVMSCDLLGQDTFDIHGGGNENVFPHNENEIAQSEALLGKKMANFWALWAMVTVDGTKMSKSLGNYTTIKDALKKYDSGAIRLWVLSSHYRSITNFSEESLEQAKSNLQRISDFLMNMEAITTHPPRINNNDSKIDIQNYLERFEQAMDDDLNTPLALSVVHEIITLGNSLMSEQKLDSETAKNILSFWNRINLILGLEIKGQAEIPKEILELAEKRNEAKQQKDFSAADEIRKRIESSGYIVEDTKDGFKIKPTK